MRQSKECKENAIFIRPKKKSLKLWTQIACSKQNDKMFTLSSLMKSSLSNKQQNLITIKCDNNKNCPPNCKISCFIHANWLDNATKWVKGSKCGIDTKNWEKSMKAISMAIKLFRCYSIQNHPYHPKCAFHKHYENNCQFKWNRCLRLWLSIVICVIFKSIKY